ncbi:MAG: hypothetical protein KatS3mg131_4014 [Candidatus Tectimicrobiota bacterium]|nr:MAG: hypothetical protein KatS3mg131_4014 [Candidatus Tectomicrobia bacterium]
MPLLPPVRREQLPPELQALWDRCEAEAPAFRNLWGTMAHSPTIFRYIWGELLELKAQSPVPPRYFELAVVTVSTLTSCAYCVSHHTPLAAAAGCTDEQLAAPAWLAPRAPARDPRLSAPPVL